jgi:hypothetical protein
MLGERCKFESRLTYDKVPLVPNYDFYRTSIGALAYSSRLLVVPKEHFVLRAKVLGVVHRIVGDWS